MLKRLFGTRSDPKTLSPRPERLSLSRTFALGLTALALSMAFSGGCSNSTPIAPPQPTAVIAPTVLPLPSAAAPTAAPPPVATPTATPPPPISAAAAILPASGSTPFAQIAVGLGGRCGLQEDGRMVCRVSHYHLRPPMLLADLR